VPQRGLQSSSYMRHHFESMPTGQIVPVAASGTRIKVKFDLRFDSSTKTRKIKGIPVGKRDFDLQIKSVNGSPIPESRVESDHPYPASSR